ncbi:MAG: flagellar hook-basal body complex protein FliE [Eubacteriales bacterium]|nr:flagellar hook-basal body complex protein FliE [Eubacteriales bacterium]
MPDISSVQAVANVINGLSASGQSTAESGGVSFQDFLSTALNEMTDTGETSIAFNDALLMGESNNLHDPMIAATEAELSVSLVVQIRDKALDAYNEIMRMQV